MIPCFSAVRTADPRSTPAIERPEPAARGQAAVAVLGQDEGRAVEAFLETRGGQPHHARVPALARHHQHRRQAFLAQHGLGLGCRLVDHREFDGLALAVELLQLLGQLAGAAAVARRQEFQRQAGIADAARRIDPRPQQEAQRIRIGLPLEARDIGQGREPGVLAPRHDLQPLRDIGAVQALERHHVADGGERHQLQPLQHVGLGARLAIEAQLAQAPVHRRDEDHGDAGGAEMALARDIVLPVGIDHREGLRQRGRGLVVIHDDGGHAQLRRAGQRVMGHDAAVERDQKLRALSFQRRHRLLAGTIALSQAVGDMDGTVAANAAQEQLQHGGRRHAVHVIVADHADLLGPHHGLGKARGPLLHVAEGGRLRHESAQRRVEEALGLFEPHAARRQHAAKDVGQVVALRDRLGQPRVRQPRLPALAGGGPLDIEKGAGHARP